VATERGGPGTAEAAVRTADLKGALQTLQEVLRESFLLVLSRGPVLVVLETRDV